MFTARFSSLRLFPIFASAAALLCPGTALAQVIDAGEADLILQDDAMGPGQPKCWARMGQALAPAGDADGDGVDDLIVGATAPDVLRLAAGGDDQCPVNDPQPSSFVSVYRGDARRILRVWDDDPITSDPSIVWGHQSGWSVDGPGDVDGDGLADVLFGAPNYDLPASTRVKRGATRVHSSANPNPNDHSALLTEFRPSSLVPCNPQPPGAQQGEVSGASVASLGFDAGGRPIFATFAPSFSTTYPEGEPWCGTQSGRLYVFAPADELPEILVTLEPDEQYENYLGPLASADLNGDGLEEVMLLREVGWSPVRELVVLDGAALAAGEIESLAIIDEQLIAGQWGRVGTTAWSTDGHESGERVLADAGDVDGDGVPDVVVSVTSSFETNDHTVAVVLSGAELAAGIASRIHVLQTARDDVRFLNRVVGSAGDVDGDGLSDLLVGLPQALREDQEYWETPKGLVNLYSGADGSLLRAYSGRHCPDDNPGADEIHCVVGASFGHSVAGADLNGDGFSDVIIGAPNYDGYPETTNNQLTGRVYAFFSGSPPECQADFNNDGTVNSQDYFDFLTGFFGPGVDFNGDGVVNSQDYFDFLTVFFNGC